MKITRRAISASFVGVTTIAALIFITPTSSLTSRLPKTVKSDLANKPHSLSLPAISKKHQITESLIFNANHGQSVTSLAELLLEVRQAVEAKQYDAGAVYPVTIDPTLTQQAYLKASNTESADFFGYSVAISGDTAVVGAYAEASNATGVNGGQSDNSQRESGAVYVFGRSGGTWSQQAYLKASNNDGPFGPNVGDRFGHVVAISGDTIIVGAPYEDSNATGVNGDQNNNLAQNSGAAYVFVRTSGTWSQQAYLKASNTEHHDAFGQTVAVSGDTVIVGAPEEDSDALGVNGNQGNNSLSDSGAAYVFVRTGGTWSQQAYLKASNADRMDYFGRSVAISGDSVVVGARNESSNATGVDGDHSNNSASASGAAYVFARSGAVWSQEAYLKASNTGPVDFFGESVAISGDTVVVGAADEDSNATGVNTNQSDNSASAAGAAYVFGRTAGVWSQQAYLKASNTEADDAFGGQVAVSGNVVVVGARFEDSSATGVDANQNSNSASQSGAAYLFARSGGAWTQQAYLKASNTDPLRNDLFGESVAISGATIMVGAAYEGSNATGVNGDQSNNSAGSSGAVYVYAPLTIVKAAQSISFPPIGNKTYGDAPLALSATASSGLPVSFAVLSGPATLADNTLTITGVGSVTVRASQNGDANYEAAADVTQSFTIQLGQPALARNNVLIVPPAGSGTITSNHLQVVTAGIPASQIVYTLVSPLPAKGQVKRNGTLVGWLLNPSTGHYYTSTAPGPRGATAAEAASYGAFLTTINNAAENVWITNNFSRVVQAYNGLNDPGGWDNGESSAYRNWYPGEPNSGQETAVHMYLNLPDAEGAQWNDIDPNERVHPGIVEKNNSSGILLSFTQADIDEGRVTYQHFAGSLATTPVDPDDFTFTVSDGAGGTISSTIFQIMVDSTAPMADIADVSPDPRTDSVATITIAFTEAVNAFDLQDFQLRRDGGSNLLTIAQTLTTSDNITWTLGNLSGLTGAPGSYTLTLTAAGSGITDVFGTPLAGDSSDAWVVFNPAPQTITFGALANKTLGDPPLTVNATASSGLPVSFSIVSGPATIAGNTVTITGAGTVVVRASQPGNANYNAATPVDQSFTVSKATASIALSGLNQSYDGTAKSATTTTSPAGLPVSLLYSQGGPPVASPTNAGSYDIAAMVNDANYQGNTVGVLTINQAAQTITFGSLPNKTFGDPPFAVNAAASSGLVVTFSIVSGPGTIFGNTVTIIGIGPVVVRASQAGNVNYNAATPVEQSFIVDDTTAPVPDVGSLPTVTGECSASITSPPTATDNFAGPIVGTTTDPTSYTTQGTFVVHWSYNDGNGNTSTQTQKVVVHDTTLPTISAPANLTAYTGSGATSCGVTIADPALGTVNASDNCVAVTISRAGVPAGNVFPLGMTTITYTVTDALGNTVSATQIVTVVDNTPPVISCPANVTVTAKLDSMSAVASYSAPDATDNCGFPIASCSIASGSNFGVGTTTVSCTATDSSNNAGSCAFTVTVLTPQGATQQLVNKVDGLVSQGGLNQGNGNALVAKLQAAINSMNKGNTNAACNQLEAFINQTQAFIKSGKLTLLQGQSWIDSANAVKAVLGC